MSKIDPGNEDYHLVRELHNHEEFKRFLRTSKKKVASGKLTRANTDDTDDTDAKIRFVNDWSKLLLHLTTPGWGKAQDQKTNFLANQHSVIFKNT